MLFKESLETLVETPKRIHRSLKEIEVKQYQAKDYTKKMEEVAERILQKEENNDHGTDIGEISPDSQNVADLDSFLHSLLRIQTIDEQIHANLCTLKNFLKDQTRIVENDLNNFDEQISKSTLILKTEMISKREFVQQTASIPENVCFCDNPDKEQLINCANEKCNFGWYHLRCVGLKAMPPGRWICRVCEKSSLKNN